MPAPRAPHAVPGTAGRDDRNRPSHRRPTVGAVRSARASEGPAADRARPDTTRGDPARGGRGVRPFHSPPRAIAVRCLDAQDPPPTPRSPVRTYTAWLSGVAASMRPPLAEPGHG